MIVYHGSNIKVEKPDVLHSRSNVDFGKGFYVTTIEEQAEKWAKRFQMQGFASFVTVYDFDFENCKKNCKVLQFDEYSEKWLDFITQCRTKNDKTDYDVVIGGVANDKVFNTIELYFDGLIEKTEAIKRLKFEKPNMQICIRSQDVLDNYLHIVDSYELKLSL